MFNWRSRDAIEEPSVLNETYLATLAKMMGDDALRELLSDGMLELDDRLGRVGDLVAAQDRDALRKLVHDICGMTGNLGMTMLCKAAADAERDLRHTDARMDTVVAPVRQHGIDAIAAVRFFLDETPLD